MRTRARLTAMTFIIIIFVTLTLQNARLHFASRKETQAENVLHMGILVILSIAMSYTRLVLAKTSREKGGGK